MGKASDEAGYYAIAYRTFETIQSIAEVEKHRLAQMEHRLIRLQLQVMERGLNTEYCLYSDRDVILSHISVNESRKSHVLECPPIFINGEMIYINPIVCVVNFHDRIQYLSSMIHELTHFFSIGLWKTQNEDATTLIHRTGIAEYEYCYSSGMARLQKALNVFPNEVITDYIASIIYREIFNEKYTANLVYSQNEMRQALASLMPNDENALIKYYFMNETEKMRELLRMHSSWKDVIKTLN